MISDAEYHGFYRNWSQKYSFPVWFALIIGDLVCQGCEVFKVQTRKVVSFAISDGERRILKGATGIHSQENDLSLLLCKLVQAMQGLHSRAGKTL
ncbi:uncharacterized protein LOC108834203 isoform X2 [Raphanus sativus]|uniref:Uncharacterized protein LOC108834203 isoform X2 n=1 Tax=Raphanus sativus TaxID=3726 RepID=A0A9W3CF86_RAPSA|nr:uncharacterized protein LOC108834203 isoform X2 [Raphanus sativus]